MTDEQKKLFYTGGVFKDYTMSFDDIGLVITNDTLHQEAVTVKESIIEDNEFVLGGCIASSIEFEVSEIIDYDLNGLEFTVNLALSEGNVITPMGKYRVNSAKRVDDKDYKKIIAYDALYDASVDVSSWYAGYFANGATHTVKETREALLTYLKIPFVSQNLVNDGVILSLTADTSVAMPGTTILRSLCVINGGFGKINRYGKFVVSYLGSAGLFPEETLYPKETLYPEDNFANLSNADDSPNYRETYYEEYEVKPITALIIQSDSEDAGVTIGSDTSNPYIIRSNFLLYGKTSEELMDIGQNIFERIRDVVYRPNTTTLDGLPYIETGDVYTLIKRRDLLESYVFSRTLTGIQALKDTYEAKGEELRANEVSVAMDIQRLQSKTSELEESIEETQDDLSQTQDDLKETQENLEEFKIETAVELEKLEDSILMRVAGGANDWDTTGYVISYYGYGDPSFGNPSASRGEYYLDQESGWIWQFQITNASQDTWWKKVKQCELVAAQLESKIQVTKDAITQEVSRAISSENSISARLSITADEISAEVTRAQNAESSLSSRISMTADEISAEVTRATNSESELSARLSITADEISSKVSKGDVVSEINQSSDTIYMRAGRFVLEGGDLITDLSGKAVFSGELKAAKGTFDSLVCTGGSKGTISGLYGLTTDWATVNNSISVGESVSARNLYATSKVTCDSLTSDSITCSGDISANGIKNRTSTAAANVRCQDGSNGWLAVTSSSSRRYKHDISDIKEDELRPERLYDLPVRQYIYNADYLDSSDMRYDKTVCGFIAEEIEKYYPIATEYNEFGEVENWNERYIIPPILALIQQQKKQIDDISFNMAVMQMQINNLGGQTYVS